MDQKYASQLVALAEKAKPINGYMVEVKGYASAVGNAAYNQILNSSSPTQLKGFADTADSLLAGKQKALQVSYSAAMKGQPNFGAAAPKPASANPFRSKGGR